MLKLKIVLLIKYVVDCEAVLLLEVYLRNLNSQSDSFIQILLTNKQTKNGATALCALYSIPLYYFLIKCLKVVSHLLISLAPKLQ